MSILSIILAIIGDLPSIVNIIKEIIAMIQGLPKGQQSAALAQLKTAYQQANATGNADALNQLHNQLVAQQVGEPPSTKGLGD